MDNLLTKPVRPADLLVAIDRLAPLLELTALFSERSSWELGVPGWAPNLPKVRATVPEGD
jgi:hypothetical protein